MNIRALITRPRAKGELLARQIEAAGGFALCCPLVETSTGKEYHQVVDKLAKLHRNDYIIAISDNAVNYANQSLVAQQQHWPSQCNYIAVGPTTAACWQQHGVKQIATPEQHDSEGMLTLLASTPLEQKNILILRGNGGRETLADELAKRAKNVTYCEVYQRAAPSYQYEELSNKWQQLGINSVIITSAEILTSLMRSLPSQALIWIRPLHFIVPSQRIAAIAQSWKIHNVTIADGASNNSLFNALRQLDMQIGIS